ncbi:hypothetical protein BGX31_011073, partial [Mortierella sp. GBA43]
MKGLKGVLSRTKSATTSDGSKKGRGASSVAPSASPNDPDKGSAQPASASSNGQTSAA